ncbi:MAG: hypothetical protein U0228_18710 [Myxococcaceae bacterium]
MDLYLSGKKVRVTDADLVGEGGEARVFRHGTSALKIFHEPTDALGRRVLDQKLQKLAAFPSSLPAAVLAPQELVADRLGRVVGYRMPLIDGAVDFGRLANRKWRTGVVSSQQSVRILSTLHHVVEAVHGAGVVIGDFNDGNVLLNQFEPLLIDADSMQFGGFACPVGHERFLDPKLYGVDLSAAPRFSTGSDWYAFAVLVFQTLLSVHPFGGTHGKLATLLRRAEARHSVLRNDVTLPRTAVSPKVLPDDLLHWFHAVFEADTRQAFPFTTLQLVFTTCSCGTEHARAVCPDCKTLGPLVTRQVLRSKGRCTARTAFETNGRIVAAAMQGGLRYLCEENGVFRREDGTVIATQLSGRHLRAELSGSTTWMADGEGHVEKWVGDRLVERARTGTFRSSPVLAAAPGHAWREEQGWLVDQETGARVGQVLEGQTHLWSSTQLGFGFYRAGGLTVAFLAKPGRAGLKQVSGLSWRGRLIEASAAFDASHVLFTVVVDDGGRDVVHRWLIRDDGTVLGANHDGPRGHGAVLGGRVVVASDGGLVALKVDSGVLVEAMSFPDTQPFVSAGDELLPNTDGSLFVVGARDITQLTLT